MRQRQFSRVSDDGRDAVSLLKSLIEQLLSGLTRRAQNSDPHDYPDRTFLKHGMCEITAANTHTRLYNTPEKGIKMRIWDSYRNKGNGKVSFDETSSACGITCLANVRK